MVVAPRPPPSLAPRAGGPHPRPPSPNLWRRHGGSSGNLLPPSFSYGLQQPQPPQPYPHPDDDEGGKQRLSRGRDQRPHRRHHHGYGNDENDDVVGGRARDQGGAGSSPTRHRPQHQQHRQGAYRERRGGASWRRGDGLLDVLGGVDGRDDEDDDVFGVGRYRCVLHARVID